MRIDLTMKTKTRLFSTLCKAELVQQAYTGTSGLYSAVTPDTSTKKFLVELSKALGFDVDPSTLHCTVMYSKDGQPDTADCAQDRVYRAAVSKLQHWPGHDEKGYLTLGIESPELAEEHARLKALGCVPTFDPYSPHVTIWSGAPMTPALQSRIDQVSSRFSPKWPELRFGNQFIGDIKED